jgi:hypothetical protein
MVKPPEKPDFIADEFGNVEDVRHLKYSKETVPPQSQRQDSTYSHAKSPTIEDKPQQKRIFNQNAAIAIIVIVAVLVCGILGGLYNRRQASPEDCTAPLKLDTF